MPQKSLIPNVLVALSLVLPAAAVAQGEAPTSSTTEDAKPQKVIVYYVKVEDPGARVVASKAAKALREAARNANFVATSSRQIKNLLNAEQDDLMRAAARTSAGRALQKEGLEHYAYVRLEPAEEVLEEARQEYLAASAAPPMKDLLNAHLYLGVVKLYQRDPTTNEEFRRAFSIKPNLRPNLPDKVLRAMARARASLGPSSGALKIDGAPAGAQIYVDGFSKGAADRSVVGLSQGMHYVWVSAPGFRPWFGEAKIPAAGDVELTVQLEPVRQTLGDSLAQGDGEKGAAAVATLLNAERFALLEARTTTAGRYKHAITARVFDAASGKKITSARVSLSENELDSAKRLDDFAKELMTRGPTVIGPSPSTLGATRGYFQPTGHFMFGIGYGFAFANRFYDDTSSLETPNSGFTLTQHAVNLDLRYGVREGISFFANVPYYYTEIDYEDWDCGGGNIQSAIKRTGTGIGDIHVGTDIRLPMMERGRIALATGRINLKLPTGNDVIGSQNCQSNSGNLTNNNGNVLLGTGQYDIDMGFVGLVGFGSVRATFAGGYRFRLPGRVGYLSIDGSLPNGGRRPAKLDPGDEQWIDATASWFATRWLAPELGVTFFRRNQTQRTSGPERTTFTAPSVTVINVNAGVLIDFSEQVQARLVATYPVYGKNTGRFFPFDVTGPQANFGFQFSY